MDALKYVVTDRGAFAVFNGLQSHQDVARSLYGKPIGAGFCRIDAVESEENANDPQCIEVRCFGRSVSLNVDSRAEVDADIIAKKLNGV